MTNTATQNTAHTLNWTPETVNGHPIEINDRLWWADQTENHKPRMVTVAFFDQEDGLIVCRDNTNQHYMTVPEELTK